MNVPFELDGARGEDFKNDPARLVLFVAADPLAAIFCRLRSTRASTSFKIFAKTSSSTPSSSSSLTKLISSRFDVRFGGGGANFFINSSSPRRNDFFTTRFLSATRCVGGYANSLGSSTPHACLLLARPPSWKSPVDVGGAGAAGFGFAAVCVFATSRNASNFASSALTSFSFSRTLRASASYCSCCDAICLFFAHKFRTSVVIAKRGSLPSSLFNISLSPSDDALAATSLSMRSLSSNFDKLRVNSSFFSRNVFISLASRRTFDASVSCANRIALNSFFAFSNARRASSLSVARRPIASFSRFNVSIASSASRIRSRSRLSSLAHSAYRSSAPRAPSSPPLHRRLPGVG